MKQFILLASFLLALFTLQSNGQDMKQMINKINYTTSQTKSGHYTMQVNGKVYSGNDTLVCYGHCYFSKENIDKDSVGHFILFLPQDSIYYIYDGESFDFISIETKYYEQRLISQKKLIDCLQGSSDYFLLDYSLLSKNRPKINLKNYCDTNLLRTKINEQIVFCLSQECIDSIGSVRKINYYIDSSQTMVSRRESISFRKDWGSTQYFETLFSQVDSIDYSDDMFFKRDSLKKSFRFKLMDYDNPEPHIDSTLKAKMISPEWELPDINGNFIQSKHVKKDFTLLDFFYKGCHPCLLTYPQIDSLSTIFSDKLSVYGIDPKDTVDSDFRDFLSKHNIKYQILMDRQKEVNNAFKVSGYPTVFLINNKTKEIIFANRGYDKDLIKRISDVINENKE